MNTRYPLLILSLFFTIASPAVFADGIPCADRAFFGTVDTPGLAMDTAIVGETLYIADGLSGMQIVDVRNINAPTLMGAIDTPGNALALVAIDSTVFVADGVAGLQIIDTSDPTAPVLLGTYNTPGTASSITVVGNTAYIADGESGVQIIDISNLTNPTLLGSYNTNGYAFHAVVRNKIVYIADGSGGLVIVDANDNTAPTLMGVHDDATINNAIRVQLSGNIAFVKGAGSWLTLIDIEDPYSPQYFATNYNSFSLPNSDLVIQGNIMIDSSGHGVTAYDISDPADPVRLNQYGFPNKTLRGITYSNGIAYIASSEDGLSILRPILGSLVIGRYDSPGQAFDAVVRDSIAYVADAISGMQILDIQNPETLVLIGSFDTPDIANHVALDGTVAYIADETTGLMIVDVSDPANPSLLSTFDTPRRAKNVFVANGLAYIADQISGMIILDVSDPTNPFELSTYNTPSWAVDIEIVGNTAFIADWGSGIHIVDVTDPTAPVLLSSIDTPGIARDVCVQNGLALVADGVEGMQLIDVSDLSNPIIINNYEFFPSSIDSTYSVAIAGNTAYVGMLDSHFYIVDITDPFSLRTVSVESVGGKVQGILVDEGTAYASVDTGGLSIIDVNSDCDLCIADITNDGSVDFFDISAFLQLFALNDPAVDFTEDGSIDFFDISVFLQAIEAGCP